MLGEVGDRLEDLAQRFGQRFGVDGVHRRVGRLQGFAERRGSGRQRARQRRFDGGDRLCQRRFELLLQAGEVERLDLAAGVAEGAFGAGAEAGELLLDGGDRVAGGVEGVGDRGADRADVEQLEHRLQAAAHVLDELGERLERVGRQGRHGEAADALGEVGEGGARLQQHQRAAQAGVERAGEFDQAGHQARTGVDRGRVECAGVCAGKGGECRLRRGECSGGAGGIAGLHGGGERCHGVDEAAARGADRHAGLCRDVGCGQRARDTAGGVEGDQLVQLADRVHQFGLDRGGGGLVPAHQSVERVAQVVEDGQQAELEIARAEGADTRMDPAQQAGHGEVGGQGVDQAARGGDLGSVEGAGVARRR